MKIIVDRLPASKEECPFYLDKKIAERINAYTCKACSSKKESHDCDLQFYGCSSLKEIY